MRTLSLADTIPHSADAAWAVIGDFSTLRRWAPVVEAEATETTPEGRVRTLTLRDGRTVKERLTDEGEHHYTYTLDRPDMAAYSSTVAVVPDRAAASTIQLTIRFEPAAGVDLTEKTDQLLKFLGGNLKAMKRAVAA